MNKDQLRDKIVTRLRWTSDPAKAEAWNEAVEAALEVVAPLLAEAEAKSERLLESRRINTRLIAGTLGEDAEEFGALDEAVTEIIARFEDAEASRRDWATEAVAMDTLAERMLTFHSQNEDRLSFVSRRYQSDGSGANFRPSRCTGVSSDALAWYAVGKRDEPKLSEYPADESDLAACERTYGMAPAWLQERMLPVLERYRAHVRPVCAVHPETREEGEECSGRDVSGQASREEAAEETVGTGYPQGSGPGRGSATPAPPSSRPVHPEGDEA